MRRRRDRLRTMPFASSRTKICVLALALYGWSSVAIAKVPGKVHCYGGVCHRVMTLAQTEQEVGKFRKMVTSFYDDPQIDRFNTNTFTSSGERFRGDSPFTAASSIYPDGTELLIWNPSNERTAHIRINDFGPFYLNRKLDVTSRVARNLDFARAGVTTLITTVIWSPTPSATRYRKARRYPAVRGFLGVHDRGSMEFLARQLILTSHARNRSLELAVQHAAPTPPLARRNPRRTEKSRHATNRNEAAIAGTKQRNANASETKSAEKQPVSTATPVHRTYPPPTSLAALPPPPPLIEPGPTWVTTLTTQPRTVSATDRPRQLTAIASVPAPMVSQPPPNIVSVFAPPATPAMRLAALSDRVSILADVKFTPRGIVFDTPALLKPAPIQAAIAMPVLALIILLSWLWHVCAERNRALILATRLVRKADTLRQRHRHSPAARRYSIAAALRRIHLGSMAPDTRRARLNLAHARHALQQLNTAASLYSHLVAEFKASPQADAEGLLEAICGLAACQRDLGLYSEAEPNLTAAQRIAERKFGETSSHVADILDAMALLSIELEDTVGAERSARHAISVRTKLDGSESASAAISLSILGEAQRHRGYARTAAHTQFQAIAILETFGDRTRNQRAICRHRLARALGDRGADGEAISELSTAWGAMKAHFGIQHPITASAAFDLALLFARSGRCDTGRRMLHEVHASRRRHLGATHPLTLHAADAIDALTLQVAPQLQPANT